MAAQLGVPQRAALFALMAAGQELPNPELKRRAGIDLKRPQREQLKDLGLITDWRHRGAVILELTDRGWRWCADEFGADCPPRAGSAGGALYAVLAGLRRYLDRTGLTPADVFAPTPPGDGAAPEAAVPAPAAPTITSTAAVEDRIRAAYRELALRPRDWVSLTALRTHRLLVELPREEVDEALRRLARTGRTLVVPQANQKMLTAGDRQAALRFGNEDNHHLAIEDA